MSSGWCYHDKLSIDIEDVADKKACVVAVQQLFAALKKHHGESEAVLIWNDCQTPKGQAWEKLTGALSGLEYSDQRLIFEYYAMALPSKEGLAKALATKNVPLNKEWREWLAGHLKWHAQYREDLFRNYVAREEARKSGQQPSLRPIPKGPEAPATAIFGSRGTTNWQTMLQQIKRVFRYHSKACAAVGEAPLEIREEVRSEVDAWCWMDTEMKIRGHGGIKKWMTRPPPGPVANPKNGKGLSGGQNVSDNVPRHFLKNLSHLFV
jgi:hypothetical protein